mgnify:CR=1 FL=1
MVSKMPNDLKKEFTHKMECLAYTYSLEEAQQVVQRMVPFGEHWSPEKIKIYIATKNVDTDNCIHYYLAMNMMYNDYHKTAEHFGQKENPDFYFDLAYDFLNDADGVDFKIEKYFKM